MYKDLAGAELARLRPYSAGRAITKIRSLPVATLDLEGTPDMERYWLPCRQSTRKDIRRKLKVAGGVRIERRHDIDDLADKIEALYEETRQHSQRPLRRFRSAAAGLFPIRGAVRRRPGSVHALLGWR